jgi:hypothetical protein
VRRRATLVKVAADGEAGDDHEADDERAKVGLK